MSKSPYLMAGRRHALGVLLAGLTAPHFAGATDTTREQERLAAVLRQLDAIERLIAHRDVPPRDERSRYHFDRERLAADLERVRAGIRDYLVPQRAQPRDPVPMTGDYTRSSNHETRSKEAPSP